MKFIIVLIIVLIILFTEELYRYVFRRKPSKLFNIFFDAKGHEENYYITRDKAKAELEAIEHKTYEIKSDRGETLKGFYYPSGENRNIIAFIVHGYRSEHNETAGMFYPYYKSRGIDLFCCDHTASGISEGDYIGFDVLETEDTLKWTEFLINEFGEDVSIILHGFSMGAATVMKMSSRCPENVKFIIEDSGFRNAKASLSHQVGPMYEPLRLINRIFAGYDIKNSDVTESLMKSEIPFLFVHGRDDRLVPYENGPWLYDFYKGEKDCFFPENTRHIESMYTNPEEYGRKIDEFIKKYI